MDRRLRPQCRSNWASDWKRRRCRSRCWWSIRRRSRARIESIRRQWNCGSVLESEADQVRYLPGGRHRDRRAYRHQKRRCPRAERRHAVNLQHIAPWTARPDDHHKVGAKSERCQKNEEFACRKRIVLPVRRRILEGDCDELRNRHAEKEVHPFPNPIGASPIRKEIAEEKAIDAPAQGYVDRIHHELRRVSGRTAA